MLKNEYYTTKTAGINLVHFDEKITKRTCYNQKNKQKYMKNILCAIQKNCEISIIKHS